MSERFAAVVVLEQGEFEQLARARTRGTEFFATSTRHFGPRWSKGERATPLATRKVARCPSVTSVFHRRSSKRTSGLPVIGFDAESIYWIQYLNQDIRKAAIP